MRIIKRQGTTDKIHDARYEIQEIRFYNDSAATNPEAAAAAIMTFAKRDTGQETWDKRHGILEKNQKKSKLSSLISNLSSLILIAGGKDKNLNYQPLADAIAQSGQVRKVILFGENKFKIERELRSMKYEVSKIELTGDLKSAVKISYKTAQTLVASGYTLVAILLSPASASFDMFKNYAERGLAFKKLVKSLK